MARAGLGVALLPTFLIEEELRAGQLVRALDGGEMKSAEAYYPAWPAGRGHHPPLRAFREWIWAETAAEECRV